MHLKLLLVAALAAIIAAAPTPAPNNDFDDGNIYTKYEDLSIGESEVGCPKTSLTPFHLSNPTKVPPSGNLLLLLPLY
ncbi:hypothetical protein L207DRAFT_593563 [Hyaloscypha variabilis F]|uniref:Uncharacterized protein n=1 Tax=Hyaloscypha variabilis (strain UAMH 11265 / GT02V1 / F) TaxID=1149755 RepID=A0A2J6QSS8_HYAVF|nr:hypothetical protein L207DRAFT_593563 [Hyaloscypha variabilis F]